MKTEELINRSINHEIMAAEDSIVFLKAHLGLIGNVINNEFINLSFILHYATSYDDINWNEYSKELVIT
jgi:hypothetical protein